MNASELAMLRMMHERRRDERVTKLSERGKHLRAFIATLPPMSAIPWFGISPLAALGVGAGAFAVGGSWGWSIFSGLAAEMVCLALDGRPSRPVSDFDDDDEWERD